MEDQKQNGSQATADFVPLVQIGTVRRPNLDLDSVRKRLSQARGQQYWRSLDELANTAEFQHYLEREFPVQAPRDMLPLDRRNFMRLMGATLALAGVGGCAYQPPEKIVPYVEQPEVLVPGKPLYFATAFPHNGYGLGVLAESHMGRPVKLEGNPVHPASLGATNIFAQASLLGLYDPDRAQSVRFLGGPSTWEAFGGDISARLTSLRASGGAGIRIITGGFTSPTLAAQMAQFLKRFPAARICLHEPANPELGTPGSVIAEPLYDFSAADRILSLDADFLHEEPGSIAYAREFMDRRRSHDAALPHKKQHRKVTGESMNRLYAIESTPTITGANADHRLPVKPSEVEAIARAIAGQLGVANAGGGSLPAGVSQQWITAVVDDLRGAAGRSVVVPGRYQSPAVQALAHAINASLGNIGKTVTYRASGIARFAGQETTLQQLTDDIRGNKVQLLLVLGVNPAYSAPADIDFAGALKQAAESSNQTGKGIVSVNFGLYEDETAEHCQWFIPESHYLEAWGDILAHDGTPSIIQPIITPLYSTHSAVELFALLLGGGDRPGYEIVREYWKTKLGGGFEQAWRQALVKGVLPNTATASAAPAVPAIPAPAAPAAGGMEISFRPDPTIGDGRWANNGWLQELPKPISQLTWDNAALLSPATAKKLGVKNRDNVEVVYQNRRLTLPAYVMPGQPADTITVHLGYGRQRAGQVGEKLGFNAYAIRTSDQPWYGGGAQVSKASGSYELASAQMHFYMEGRELVKHGTIEAATAEPNHPHFMGDEHTADEEQSLYKPMWPSDTGPIDNSVAHGEGGGEHGAESHDARPQMDGTTGVIAGAPHRDHRDVVGPTTGVPVPAWGMVIDLNACTGCNACVLACQAENNISTVGKDQVLNNREMHWIRLTTYYTGTEDDPQDPVFQPVPCMHCEKAPCEPVCPVEATSHSPEGINEMTYNRCIGTRYCENNCPYKVRRFNYLQYSDQKSPSIELMRNPDVTVRSRGVMEKCTYCVQRVNMARIEAEKEDRPIRDGDVVTACQQVCPTDAIIFGDTRDTKSNDGKGSAVRQLKLLPLNYTLLTELNTRPRTSYLARLRNPNPALAGTAAAHGASEAEH